MVNPNISETLSRTLAMSDNIYVLRRLAENPNISVELQHELAKSNDDNVLSHLTKNQDNPTIISKSHKVYKAKEKNIRNLRKLAKNLNSSREILLGLYNSGKNDLGVFRALAANPNTPVKLLLALAHSADTDILWGLAGNSTTPIETLKQLFE